MHSLRWLSVVSSLVLLGLIACDPAPTKSAESTTTTAAPSTTASVTTSAAALAEPLVLAAPSSTIDVPAPNEGTPWADPLADAGPAPITLTRSVDGGSPPENPANKDAIGRVERLAEVAYLPGKRTRVVRGPCSTKYDIICPGAGELEVRVEQSHRGQWWGILRFFVPPKGRSVFVDSGFGLYASPEPRRLAYPHWSRMDRRRKAGIAMVLALPEVDTFGRWLVRQGSKAEPLSLSLWTEGYPDPRCQDQDRACGFHYYVGEHHITHSVRWQGFYVQPDLQRVRVVTTAQDLSYDDWKKADPFASYNAPETRRLTAPWPRDTQRGSVGYGAPDRSVTDVASYRHPTKTQLAKHGFVLTKVELYEKGSYPVFFVKRREEASSLLERAKAKPWTARQVAHEILRKNSGFPYEIVDETNAEPDRYRFRGAIQSFERKTAKGWRTL